MGMRNSYGEQLRQARLRRGMDIHSVSRRLRIRLDILHAIEEADFAALPPAGYTRNMITAYARLVGLDPRQMAEGYLDEAHRFETGRMRDRAPEPGAARRRGGAVSRRAPMTSPLEPPARRPPERSIYDRGGTQRVRYSAYEDHPASLPPARRAEPEPAGRAARPTRGSRRGGDAGPGAFYGRDLAPQRSRRLESASTPRPPSTAAVGERQAAAFWRRCCRACPSCWWASWWSCCS